MCGRSRSAPPGCDRAAVPTDIRFPSPLRPGDRIGVTAPSSGVPEPLRPRLDFCVEHLREQGYDVVLGDCLDGDLVSAAAAARAAELTSMLADPTIRAVVPPWGGELAVELLPHLDLVALREAEPTWLVGWSDLSTLLLPLTLVTGWATLHGGNLMETPYALPEPLLHWLQVAGAAAGQELLQGAAAAHAGSGWADWTGSPRTVERSLSEPSSWRLLDPGAGPLRLAGRLIGGCVETVSTLAGSSYGDVAAFGARSGPLVVYLEAAEAGALTIARDLWRLRLAGWFDHASAVLVGRTSAPAEDGFTQEDAVRSALGDLGVPVVLDVDCGHVPPQLALVNGARVEVVVDGGEQTLRQTLV